MIDEVILTNLEEFCSNRGLNQEIAKRELEENGLCGLTVYMESEGVFYKYATRHLEHLLKAIDLQPLIAKSSEFVKISDEGIYFLI